MKYLISFLLIFAYLNIYSQEFRQIDGTDNSEFLWGSTGDLIENSSTVSFEDGISQPTGLNRPNPRTISNMLFDQRDVISDEELRSAYIWVFGQFLDHDLSLTVDSHQEFSPVIVPPGDEFFGTGSMIPMFRSLATEGSGTDVNNPRRYSNEITSFIDGSNVYGSDSERALWLRTNDGTGKLKTSGGNLLPWNTPSGNYNDTSTASDVPHMDDGVGNNIRLFVAGDVRANENPLLITMHTLFVREHNRLCDKLIAEHPGWDGELIYQVARKYVGAYLQAIVYEEWLPAQGIKLSNYSGYNDSWNPRILNSFSTAAFRLGHTLINDNLIRMSNSGDELSIGNISLRDAFFNPTVVIQAGGIDPYLKGMATQVQQKLDCKVISDVRNFLFGTPEAGGLDLASININRGRERGLADYNTLRSDFGMPRLQSFLDLTSNEEEAALMESIYGSIDNVDAWVGMLAEQHMPDAMVGELIMKILERQFSLLRDGDRFYYENDPYFSAEDIEEIRNTSLHDIIMRNTDISLMQDNVFEAMSHEDIPNGPDITPVQLNAVVYPNPTRDVTHIKVYVDIDQDITVRVISDMGKLVSEKVYSLHSGDNFITLDFNQDFPRGFYNVFLESDHFYNIVRIMKEN